MHLSIRLVRGLFKLLPFPSERHFMEFTTSYFINEKRQLDPDTISVQYGSVQEIVLALNGLITSLKKTQYLPAGIQVIPLQFTAHDHQDIKESVWGIAPPGYLLLEENPGITQAQKWIYGYSVVNIGHQMPVEDMKFPFRLLLVAGPKKNECFFCGRRWHESTNCPNILSEHAEGDRILKALATYAPNVWQEKIKNGTKTGSFLDGLYALMAALRGIFTPRHAIKVLISSVPDIIETGRVTNKAIPKRLLPLFNAVDAQDLKKFKHVLEETTRGTTHPEYYIFKGFMSISEGDTDSALMSLKRAETFAKTPKVKAYSLLLQSRIHLLWGGIEGAWASISNAAKLLPKDPHIQYWYVVTAGILRDNNRFNEGLKRLSSNPMWLTRLVCEPLLVGHTLLVENRYDNQFTDILEKVESDTGSLETLCNQGQKAFSKGNFKPHILKLRDIKGKIPNLGLLGLADVQNSLKNLSNDVYKEINRNYRAYYKELVSTKKKLILAMKNMHDSQAMVTFRKRAQNLLQAITKDIKTLRNIKKIDEMADIGPKVKEWNATVSELIQDVNEIIEKEYRNALIRKYCAIGIAITLASWGLFYIYHILKNLIH